MTRILAVFFLIVATVGTCVAPQAAAANDPLAIDKAASKIEFHAKATFTKVEGVFRSLGSRIAKKRRQFCRRYAENETRN